jgi:hypothetical protein
MENAGMSEEEYMNPELVADRFLTAWEKSGTGRIGAVAVCESAQGVYHMHMVYYGNTTTLKAVSDISFQSHVEPVKGKAQLLQYITKEGKYAEKGEKILYTKNLEVIESNQGKRNDLDIIEEMLNNGATPEEIFEESFRYRKYEKMIKAEYLARRIKETPLVKEMWNEYHWGRSGTGKTYTYVKLCEKYHDEVYLCNDYANSGASGGGFDFYTSNPAKIIVLDEFRGNIPYNQFLSLLDVYSRNQQHCRYQNTYNLWTSVIICSIYPPEKAYSFMVDETQKSVDSIQQLMRRLNVIVYHYINKDGKYRTFRMPADEYVNANDMIERAIEYEKVADEIDALGEVSDTDNPSLEEFIKTWDAVAVKE